MITERVAGTLERSQNSFYDLCFYAQTVWPSTLTHTNGLASNFYAQTVWPPTKPVTQLGEVGCKIDFPEKMKTTMVGPFARSIGMAIELVGASSEGVSQGILW
jgi:hypothetical protein